MLAAVDRGEAAVGAVADRVRRADPPLPPGARWALVFGQASPMWVRVARPLLIVAWISLSYVPVRKPVLAVLLVLVGVVFLVLENRARRDLHRELTRPGASGHIRLAPEPGLSPRQAATTAVACFAAAIALSLALAAVGVGEQLTVALPLGACMLTLMWIDHRSTRQ